MKKLDKHLLEVSGRVCAMEQLGGEQLGEDNLLPSTDDLGQDGPYGELQVAPRGAREREADRNPGDLPSAARSRSRSPVPEEPASVAAKVAGLSDEGVHGEPGAYGGFGGGVGEGCVIQGKSPLDGGDVNDDSSALLDHRRHKETVESHRGEEVDGEFICPYLLGCGGEASGRGVRAADDVDDAVGGAESILKGGGEVGYTRLGG